MLRLSEELQPALQRPIMTVLVVCRVEHSSRVPSWLKALDGTVTLACSTYGSEPEAGVHSFRGGKWAGLHDFFETRPDLLQAYDYFWFPDDDIETTVETAQSFLSLCIREKFELAQPALTPHSYFAYRQMIENRRFSFRRTNFVELMMPLMRRDFLLRTLPFFEGKHAALGLDWMWQKAAAEPCKSVAIVDDHPMLHSRPRNRHLAAKMRQQNISLEHEKAQTFEKYNIQRLVPIAYGGRLKSGLETHNKGKLVLELLLGYLANQGRTPNGRWTIRDTMKLVLQQLTQSRNKA